MHPKHSSLPPTGNTEYTRPENRVTYPALDGLRAIAFLLVFGQHYIYLPWGWSGVSIFFVLSGFLITGILLDTRDTPHRARNFYVRRTLRIFPLYWGIFLAILLSTPFLHWKLSLPWLAWPLYLGNYLRYISASAARTGFAVGSAASGSLLGSGAFTPSLFVDHFWSLCVEEQFYLLWPWFVFLRSRRSLLVICGTVVMGLPLLRMYLHAYLPLWAIKQDVLYRTTPLQLDALLVGAGLAVLWRTAHRDRLVALARLLAPLLLATALVYLGLHIRFVGPHPFGNYGYPAWEYTWGMSFVDLTAAALLLCALQPGTLTYTLLRRHSLRWLGRISYGGYIFHMLLINAYQAVLSHFVRLAGYSGAERDAVTGRWLPLFALGSTILVAWASFRFFESPFLNLKDRWTTR